MLVAFRRRDAARGAPQHLLERIRKGEIDPSFVVTHTMSLDEAPAGYSKFMNKEDDCIKIILKP